MNLEAGTVQLTGILRPLPMCGQQMGAVVTVHGLMDQFR